MSRLVQFKHDFPPFLKDEQGILLYLLNDHPDFPVIQIGSRVSVVNWFVLTDLGEVDDAHAQWILQNNDQNARVWQLEQELTKERERAAQLALEQLHQQQSFLEQQQEKDQIEKDRVALEKLKIKHQTVIKNQTIGFMGVESGSGTTHAAITTAMYLSKSGFRVAYLEWSDRLALDSFMTNEPMRVHHDEFVGFHLMGIDFIKKGNLSTYLSLMNHQEYDFLVVDFGFGYLNAEKMNEFIRMTRTTFVTKGAIWDLIRLSKLLFSTTQEVHLIVNFTDDGLFKDVKQMTKTHGWICHKNEYSPNVFEQKRKEVSWLHGLVKSKKWFFK